MPFVLRVVEPKYLSRTSLRDAEGVPKVDDDELLAVTNCTLSNALRQLASLVVLANDIFDDLAKRLDEIGQRSVAVKTKIAGVAEKVELFDPKKVTVPEGNLSDFALRKDHYECKTELSINMFVEQSRPRCLKQLYESAGRTSPGPLGESGGNRSPLLLCTPVLGARQRKLREKVDVDIETRKPAAVEDLRKWTSAEALGDMTVIPGITARIPTNISLAPEEVSDGGGFSSGDDEPIDHKLPSPEEQFNVIASKFCPEIVPIDTSGRGFDRMCTSRRSLLHVDATCDQSQNADSQTVKRRTRSRKPRGKRRNTITGTDQKEIRDAIAGDISSPADDPESPDSGAVIRSHSSDLLKKSPSDVPNKKSHFNTLRQWGRSRLRLMSRSPSDCRESTKTEKAKSKSPTTVQDIDDVNTYETVTMRRRKNVNNKQQDRKISHERNNSYSSSEKSMGMPISMPLSGPNSIAVKLREVSSTGRRRRITQNGPIKDEPHSSSGNWSASSESGRTSIGSEITSTTAAPRSTTSAATSSNSLNVPHGPPSSIVSRRRFLNTSGSGSVTSEGTLTPDIIHDLHDDMETSSEFSCDTEGYYTSFHMDSGLKTLKEEEISLPITPLHTTSTFSTSSGNQNISIAESEYELFGKGSTSTTTSSAGTVCTTLLAAGSDRSLVSGPTVPERKSSLSKLNKSRSSSGSSSINLERSYSNSTTGSNSDRTGTVKRNSLNKSNKMNLPLSIDSMPQIKLDNCPQQPQIMTQETIAVVHEIQTSNINTGAESPDSGHNTSSSPIDDSVSSAHGGKLSCSEMDYSESSDLEGVDRIERIRVKTTINSSRIPSMCVITPNNSDDESVPSAKNEINEKHKHVESDIKISSRPMLELPPHETDLDTLVFNDEAKNYANIYSNSKECIKSCVIDTKGSNVNKNGETNTGKVKKSFAARSYKSGLIPLNNLMCKLKEVFPQKLSMKKSQPKETPASNSSYTDNGEYVTIADVRNNNQKVNINNTGGVYYSNDVVKRNLQTVLSGKLHETEYVSLNELPSNISSENVDTLPGNPQTSGSSSNDSFRRFGARVTLDATGKVIYSSDSLKRRKGAHTTFEPGPFVKDIETNNADECDSTDSSKTLVAPENLSHENGIPTNSLNRISPASPTRNIRPMSPQLGKVIIRAPNINAKTNTPTSEVVRMPPMNIVTPTNIVRPMSPRTVSKGAYVNIQDAEGISLSPTKDNSQDFRRSADQPVKTIFNYPTVSSAPVYNSHLRSSLQSVTGDSKQRITVENIKPEIVQKPVYWTLQPNKSKNLKTNENVYNSSSNNIVGEIQTEPRASSIKDILRPTFDNSMLNAPLEAINKISNYKVSNLGSDYSDRQQLNSIPNMNGRSYDYVFNSTPNSATYNDDSLKISPIDPRNVKFHASTPTHSIKNSSQNADSNSVTSPVKSTMSNEELYAVIHKSKKKMNIKSPPLDRATSPALSSTSLSPGSSESSIPGRLTPSKFPETGYLTDARNRHSWSPNVQEKLSPLEQRAYENRQDNSSRQTWTCSDRLGPPPQTSRLDFKKLLLQHGVKLNLHGTNKPPPKISAVERLRLSREAGAPNTNPNISNINILDLSGSPKTYTHRRVIRNNVLSPSSPSRTNVLLKESKTTPKILLSPKTQWRFSSPRSDVLSSPIPEAFNEDESPNSSTEKDREQIAKDFIALQNNLNMNPSYKLGANVKRNLIPNTGNVDKIKNGIMPLNNNLLPRNEENQCTNLHCNNSTEKQYISSGSPGKLTRAEYIQAQKAQFLSQNMPKSTLPVVNSFSRNSVIMNSQLSNSSPPRTPINREPNKCPSPPTLETAL